MRAGTPAYREHQDFQHLHKGAGLAALVALFVLGRPAGIKELEVFTPYSAPSLRAALKLLEEREYVVRIRYQDGYQLTSAGRQLPLFGAAEVLGPVEPDPGSVLALQSAPESADKREKFFPFSGGGSGGMELGDGLNKTNHYLNTTTTTTEEENFFAFPPGLRRMVQALLSMGGLSPEKAEDAVRQAVGRGGTEKEIEVIITACTTYLMHKRSRTLSHPGAWAAQFVAKGYSPPDVEIMPDHDSPEQPGSRTAGYDGYLTLQDPYPVDDEPTEGENPNVQDA